MEVQEGGRPILEVAVAKIGLASLFWLTESARS